jgi:branched-chain amino acid transport system permease protein/neutral amino acid transport system permease protein
MAQLVVVGLIVGSVIALGAIGLTLIYGVLKFANFAHGDFMTVGAYVAFFAFFGNDHLGPLSFGYGMLLGILAAMVGVAVLSVAIDRIVYRPLRNRKAGLVILAMASLGMAMVVRSMVYLLWGPDQQFYVPGIQKALSLPLDIRLKPDQIFIGCTAIVVVTLVYLLLYRTKLGKAMRATADNMELARISGIDTEKVVLWTWAIGGALAGLAGVLLGIQSHLMPEMGFIFLLPLFSAAILGGVGSPQGALVGALIVGVSQEVSTEWISPAYKPAVAFMLLFAILLFKPTGIFGAKA